MLVFVFAEIKFGKVLFSFQFINYFTYLNNELIHFTRFQSIIFIYLFIINNKY